MFEQNIEEKISQFLQLFKITLINSSIYFPGHNLLRKNLEKFQESLTAIFDIENGKYIPLHLAVSPKDIFIAGQQILLPGERNKLVNELANILHNRKIKSLWFYPGVNIEELESFFSVIAMPLHKLLIAGGCERLLQEKRVEHIKVEFLDYRQLLLSPLKGEELKDVWSYLLLKVNKEEIPLEEEIKYILDNFSAALNNLNPDQLAPDKELFYNTIFFLKKYKEKYPKEYEKMCFELLEYIGNNSAVFSEADLDKQDIKEIFNFLTNDKIKHVYENIKSKKRYPDKLILKVFKTFLPEEKMKSLKEDNKLSLLNPAEKEKMSQAFNLSLQDTEKVVNPFYRDNLMFLLSKIKETENIVMDKETVDKSYKYSLINLLGLSNDEVAQEHIIDTIEGFFQSTHLVISLDFVASVLFVLHKKLTTVVDETLINKIASLQYNIFDKYKIQLLNKIDDINDDFVASIIDLFCDFPLPWQKIFENLSRNNFGGKKRLALAIKAIKNKLPKLVKFIINQKNPSGILDILDRLREIDSPESSQMAQLFYFYLDEKLRVKILSYLEVMNSCDEQLMLKMFKVSSSRLKKNIVKILISRQSVFLEDVLEQLLIIPTYWGL